MTGRTRIAVIATIVVLGILGYGYLSDSKGTVLADEQSKKEKKETTQEDPKKFEAPDFTLKNLDGDEVSLSDYKGKIVRDGRKLKEAEKAEIYEGICW